MTSTPHDVHQHGPGAGTPAPTAPPHSPDDPALVTLTVETGSLACEACGRCIEDKLRENPHVVGVHVDPPHEVEHVAVHEGMVTAGELEELIADACGERNLVPL